jgi:polyisoprenoid-binding protein YceI
VLVADPAQGSFKWTVNSTLHAVHGTFALKSARFEINTDTDRVTGEVLVDAASGDSGDQSRDRRMHSEILQSDKFTEVIFRPESLDGKVALSGSSEGRLKGAIVLHGSEHETNVPVRLELGSDRWKGTASVAIPYVEWGLKDPSNFLLRVAKVVNFEVVLAGSVYRNP